MAKNLFAPHDRVAPPSPTSDANIIRNEWILKVQWVKKNNMCHNYSRFPLLMQNRLTLKNKILCLIQLVNEK